MHFSHLHHARARLTSPGFFYGGSYKLETYVTRPDALSLADLALQASYASSQEREGHRLSASQWTKRSTLGSRAGMGEGFR